MEQGGLPGSLLLAPFQELVQEAAAETQAVLYRMLSENCRAEGISQFQSLEAWNIAQALYRRGFLAERECPCPPSG